MLKMWVGLPFAAVITAGTALAQNYNKNWYECAHELGLSEVVRPSGDHLRQFRLNSEQQMMVFNDCVARKAKLAPTAPPSKPATQPAVVGSRSQHPNSGSRCLTYNGREYC